MENQKKEKKEEKKSPSSCRDALFCGRSPLGRSTYIYIIIRARKTRERERKRRRMVAEEEEEREDVNDDVVKEKKEHLDAFVRNLPHTTTDESLENAFSEIGLVRQAWVAREKGTNVHRGFGYVTFSLREDLEAALKLDGKLEIEGRKVGILRSKEKEKVDFKEKKRLKREAREKTTGEEGAARENATEKNEQQQQQQQQQQQPTPATKELEKETETKKEELKQKRIRQSRGASASTATAVTPEEKKTVIIAGLKIGGEIKGVDPAKVAHFFRTDKRLKKSVSEETAKILAERFDQSAKEKPADDETCKRYKIREDGATRGIVLLKLEHEDDVKTVVERMHKLKFEETKKDKQQKKVNFEKRAKDERDSGDVNVDDDTLWSRALVGEGANPKKHRVILRNLAFHATEKQIRDSIAKNVSDAAFVWDVSIPIDQKTKKMRGFAFVAFITAKDAVACVEKMNGQKVAGRVVAVDVALSKRQEKENQVVAAAQAVPKEKSANDDDDDDDEDDDDA